MNWTLTNSQRQEMVDDFLTVVPARPANMDRMIRGSCHSSRRRAALATGGGERAGRNGSCDNCGNVFQLVFPTAVSSTLLLMPSRAPSSMVSGSTRSGIRRQRGGIRNSSRAVRNIAKVKRCFKRRKLWKQKAEVTRSVTCERMGCHRLENVQLTSICQD
jgi:hypothetical protein